MLSNTKITAVEFHFHRKPSFAFASALRKVASFSDLPLRTLPSHNPTKIRALPQKQESHSPAENQQLAKQANSSGGGFGLELGNKIQKAESARSKIDCKESSCIHFGNPYSSFLL